MGFHPTFLIWALPAIVLAGSLVTVFALLRPRSGVREGFRLRPGLRLIDAASRGFHAVTQLFVLLAWIMLPWREIFERQLAPFWLLLFAWTIGMMLVLGLTTSLTTVVIRRVLRRAGVLSAEQAAFYPLRANKMRLDPWPLCWQEPSPGSDGQQQDG